MHPSIDEITSSPETLACLRGAILRFDSNSIHHQLSGLCTEITMCPVLRIVTLETWTPDEGAIRVRLRGGDVRDLFEHCESIDYATPILSVA